MNKIKKFQLCPDCKALSFTLNCCCDGKVLIPPPMDQPEYVRNLLTGAFPRDKHFQCVRLLSSRCLAKIYSIFRNVSVIIMHLHSLRSVMIREMKTKVTVLHLSRLYILFALNVVQCLYLDQWDVAS